MKIRYLSILLLFILSGCFKEDDPVAPMTPGDVTTTSIEMMEDYRYQVYYNLKDDNVVAQNMKKNWDLAFESGTDDFLIRLNTANFMWAADTYTTDFESVTDTAGYDWDYDKSDGNPDSTVLKNWANWSEEDLEWQYTKHVYLINRGFDEIGNERGIRKMVFSEVTDSTFRFQFANLDGSGNTDFLIHKDPTVSHVHFSFDEGGLELIQEPEKEAWDILFTQYTTLLYTDVGEAYPYLVTGVMRNPYFTLVARDTVTNFADIDLSFIDQVEFKAEWDYIGYDWKDVVGDVSSGNVTYTIVEGLNYIIRDNSGFYYKLRFINFYNNSGDKGYPTFEFQRL